MNKIAIGFLAFGMSVPSWGLSVTPGRTEVRLLPGKSVEAPLQIKNDAAEKVWVEVSTKDWFVLEANKAFPISQWLSVKGKKQFSLDPGQERTLKVKVSAPKEAMGELVGMVSLAYQKEEAGMVTPMISVSFYAEVDGTARVEGEIRDVVARRWQNKLQLAAMVRSTGNVHLRPTGSLKVSNAKNQTLISIPVVTSDPAYPQNDRGYFGAPQEWILTPGRYLAAAELTYRGLDLKGSRYFNVSKDGQIQMEEAL